MRRGRVAGLVVALLVVGSATLLAAQPATAATYPDAGAACGQTSDGQHLIGILPGSSTPTDAQVLTGTGGNVSLYPGTTLRLALCEDGTLLNTYGSEWAVSDSSDLDVLDTSDATATVRVTSEARHVDVLALVDEKNEIPAVAIDVPQLPTVDSGLANATITFENPNAADNYAANESEYLAAAASLRNATGEIDNLTATVESGDAVSEGVTEESLTRINETRRALDNRTAALERRTYDTAFAARGESNALEALEVAQERERAADREAEAAMRDHLGTLETAESNARSSALVNLVGALLAGLVVGAVPGWKLTSDRLERIRQDREVNSSVSYSPRVLAWAVGLAALALALTLAALFALGGFGKLGGLL